MAEDRKPTLAAASTELVVLFMMVIEMSDDVAEAKNPAQRTQLLERLQSSLQKNKARLHPFMVAVVEAQIAEKAAGRGGITLD